MSSASFQTGDECINVVFMPQDVKLEIVVLDCKPVEEESDEDNAGLHCEVLIDEQHPIEGGGNAEYDNTTSDGKEVKIFVKSSSKRIRKDKNSEKTRKFKLENRETPACPYCGKVFTCQAKVTIHLRAHTGVKPYNCKECGKSFTQSANLARHEIIHAGIKPFQCEECKKCFSQVSNLSKHKLIHNTDKDYKCPQCGKYLSNKYGLANHQRALHSNTSPTPIRRNVEILRE